MYMDEPFPLEAIPSRVQHPLLREFEGRCPSLREVDQILDKQWLATPGIGPTYLEMIRSITRAGREPTVTHAASPSLSDVQLLRRLERLQAELQSLEAELKARMLTGPRRKPNHLRRDRATRDEANHSGHWADTAEASHQRSGRGYAA